MLIPRIHEKLDVLASISNHSAPPKRQEEAGTGRSLESHKAASTGYTICNEEVTCLQQGGQWGSVLEAGLSWNICAHGMKIHAQKLREKNKNAVSAEIIENIEREYYYLNTVRYLENNIYKIIKNRKLNNTVKTKYVDSPITIRVAYVALIFFHK